MIRRKPSTIIREIIRALKEKPLSLRALDIKLNTSSRTIKEYTALLQDLGILKLSKIKKGKKIITKAELTELGKKIK